MHRFGGILESADKEWTLDDFHSIQLDKLDRFHCFRECIMYVAGQSGASYHVELTDLVYSDNADWHGSDSENDSSDSEEGSDEDDDDKDSDEDDASSDDGIAPADKMEDVPVQVQELALTDAEQAALVAKRLAEEVSAGERSVIIDLVADNLLYWRKPISEKSCANELRLSPECPLLQIGRPKTL